jgi:hypothetical protein
MVRTALIATEIKRIGAVSLPRSALWDMLQLVLVEFLTSNFPALPTFGDAARNQTL